MQKLKLVLALCLLAVLTVLPVSKAAAQDESGYMYWCFHGVDFPQDRCPALADFRVYRSHYWDPNNNYQEHVIDRVQVTLKNVSNTDHSSFTTTRIDSSGEVQSTGFTEPYGMTTDADGRWLVYVAPNTFKTVSTNYDYGFVDSSTQYNTKYCAFGGDWKCTTTFTEIDGSL
jgi:hypothetical protein